eukprot:761118-Hanusia_phi.AAC.2
MSSSTACTFLPPSICLPPQIISSGACLADEQNDDLLNFLWEQSSTDDQSDCSEYNDTSLSSASTPKQSPYMDNPSAVPNNLAYLTEDPKQLPPCKVQAKCVQLKKRRVNRPKHNHSKIATDIFKQWFYEHLDYPFPSDELKASFADRTGLSYTQVSTWFINARKRVWKPLKRTGARKGAKSTAHAEAASPLRADVSHTGMMDGERDSVELCNEDHSFFTLPIDM